MSRRQTYPPRGSAQLAAALRHVERASVAAFEDGWRQCQAKGAQFLASQSDTVGSLEGKRIKWLRVLETHAPVPKEKK